MISTIKKIQTPQQVKGLLDYLTDTQEHQLKILEGDPEETRELMKQLQTKNKGWHIVLSFSPEDNITPEKRDRILKAIKQLYFIGYKEEELRPLILEHTEKQHYHIHIVLPNYNPEKGRALNWNISTRARGDINRLIEILEDLQPPAPQDLYTPHTKQSNRNDVVLGEILTNKIKDMIKQGKTFKEIEKTLQQEGYRIWVKEYENPKTGQKSYYLKITDTDMNITTEIRGSIAQRWIQYKQGHNVLPPQWYQFMDMPDLLTNIQKHIDRRIKTINQKYHEERERRDIHDILRDLYPIQMQDLPEIHTADAKTEQEKFIAWIFDNTQADKIQILMRNPKTGDGTKRTLTRDNYKIYMPYIRAMNTKGYDVFIKMPENYAVLDDVNDTTLKLFQTFQIPTMAIETSPGKYHAIFILEEPQDRQMFDTIRKAFNIADKRHNLQSTRLPGTRNWKYPQKHFVRRRTQYITLKITKALIYTIIKILTHAMTINL